MSLNFGSQKTKQSIQEPSGTEVALTQANTELAQLQVQQQKEQIAAQQRRDLSADTLKWQLSQTNDPKEQAAIRQALNDNMLQSLHNQLDEASTKNLLARATGQAPILTPEQQASLDQMFNLTSKRATESLNTYGEEIAGQRGMTVADSPIGNEMLRQKRDLEEGLASTKTQAALDLGSRSDLFNQNLQQFQAQLRQQAYQNRLTLSSQQPASYGLQNMLLAQRMPYMNTINRGASGGLSGGGGSAGRDAGSSMMGIAALAAL